MQHASSHTRNTSLTVTFPGDSKDKPALKLLPPSPLVRAKKNITDGGKETEHLDELDLILCHEDFTELVSLSKKVKNLHQILQRGAPEARIYYEQNMPATPKSSLTSKEVMDFVERLREGLSSSSIIIRRGAYPVTDATLDDNFGILQRELEYCESCIRKAATALASASSSSSSSGKYAKWQSDILFRWLVENHKAPKLSRDACMELARRTGLSTQQVSTWLQNMRRRRQTNTVKGSKKATHFLDFLFLAHDREKSNAAAAAAAQELEAQWSQKRSREYDDSSYNSMMLQPYSIPSPPYDHDMTDDLPSPPPTAVTESFEQDHQSSMQIDPIDLVEYEYNGQKFEESELLQVFAQAWQHEAQAALASAATSNPPPPPPLPESRDDDDDFDMDIMGDDISPFGSSIFRKRTRGCESLMEDGEFAVAAI